MALPRPDEEEEALAAALLLSLAKGAAPRRPRWFEGYEPEVTKRLRAYLTATRRRVLGALGDEVGAGTMLRIEGVLVDPQAAAALHGALADSLGQTAVLATREGYGVAAAMMEMRKAVPTIYGGTLDQANERGMDWADQHAARLVTNINATTRDMIREGVTATIESGGSVRDLAEVLSDSLAFSDYRSTMIARTELAFANKHGNLEGYKVAGLMQKEWSVSQDEVCDWCMELDGEVIPIDQDFLWGPHSIPVPCPPGHPNCRCDLLPVTKYDLNRMTREEETQPIVEPPVEAPPAPPPPAPVKPAAPLWPPPPPDTDRVVIVQDKIIKAAPKVLGGEVHAEHTVRLDSPEVSASDADRTWTGIVEMGPAVSDDLRVALRALQSGSPLGHQDAEAVKMLVHEDIHGLGRFRRAGQPAATDVRELSPEVIGGYAWENARYYSTPVGHALEEGATELYAVHKWRDVAKEAGFNVSGTTDLGAFRFFNGARARAYHTYHREVTAVEALCQFAAGQPLNPGEMTAATMKVLRSLHVDVSPTARSRFLASKIAKHAATKSPGLRQQIADWIELWISSRMPKVLRATGAFYPSHPEAEMAEIVGDQVRREVASMLEAPTPEALDRVVAGWFP